MQAARPPTGWRLPGSRGARFDAWSELFREEAWREAAQEVGIDAAEAIAETSYDTVPRHAVRARVHRRVRRAFLALERRRAAEARQTTPELHLRGLHRLRRLPGARSAQNELAEVRHWLIPACSGLRVAFCKQGRLALLSHLEVARALGARRAPRGACPTP